MKPISLLVAVTIVTTATAALVAIRAQDVIADPTSEPTVPSPAYPAEAGPRVGIDAAHHNSQSLAGNLAPLGKLLRADGYRVEEFKSTFSAESLRRLDILVVMNALSQRNSTNGALPAVSAFEASELDAVERWVANGGALLLVAGHMPWPGCAEALAERFDVFFQNGFTFPQDPDTRELIMTGAADKKGLARSSPVAHPIFTGRSPKEAVPSIASGAASQALRLRPGGKATPLLILDGEWMLLFPEAPWDFSEKTPRIRADHMPIAAAGVFGRGRVVIIGVNAAALTAQVVQSTGKPWGIGFNQPASKHNAQFALNTFHWLSGLLPSR